MKKIVVFKLVSNDLIAKDVYKMVLKGDTSWFEKPGQFVDVKCDGLFLRRPISISKVDNDELTLIYKVVGKGTKWLSERLSGEIECLVGLGNGYDLLDEPSLLVGGGVGVPPLLELARKLRSNNVDVTCVLGFQSQDDVFYVDEFNSLGCTVYVSTNDGSYGTKGFVTDIIKEKELQNLNYMACGPKVMLKAVALMMKNNGQLSFEERMGCGYGGCMGCSLMTKKGAIRICKEGPVIMAEDIIWED